jgi:hypothetical protein
MDELNGLDNTEEEVNEPVTESSEEVTDTARLEDENKNLRDGNSRLGREFKAYKEDNEDRYNTLLDKISEIKYQSPPPAAEKEDDLFDLGGSYDDDSVIDSKRMEKMVEAKVQKMEEDRSKKRDQYINEYTKEVRTLGLEEDGHTYEAILKSMEGLPGYSENGKLDAQRNYEIAERNYYKNMYKSIQNPVNNAFRGEKAGGAVGGSTAMSSKTASEPDIAAALNDEHVQAYMKRRKKDENFVKKAMANKSPMSGTMKL